MKRNGSEGVSTVPKCHNWVSRYNTDHSQHTKTWKKQKQKCHEVHYSNNTDNEFVLKPQCHSRIIRKDKWKKKKNQ